MHHHLFHLVTHAFFKCLLFLSAGIIIHEMQHLKDEHNLDIDPQNILYMGGLRKKLPLTFAVCMIAALALIGMPLTSGYLSKDGILIQAFEWAGGKSWVFCTDPGVWTNYRRVNRFLCGPVNIPRVFWRV
jgi:NADH-quinone oxidoreductase subunit L